MSAINFRDFSLQISIKGEQDAESLSDLKTVASAWEAK